MNHYPKNQRDPSNGVGGVREHTDTHRHTHTHTDRHTLTHTHAEELPVIII